MIPVAAPYVRLPFLVFRVCGSQFDMCIQKDYAGQIVDRLSALGLYAEVDNSDNTLPKKIRNGEISQTNFILGMSTHYLLPHILL